MTKPSTRLASGIRTSGNARMRVYALLLVMFLYGLAFGLLIYPALRYPSVVTFALLLVATVIQFLAVARWRDRI
jgi:hypothetical protein